VLKPSSRTTESPFLAGRGRRTLRHLLGEPIICLGLVVWLGLLGGPVFCFEPLVGLLIVDLDLLAEIALVLPGICFVRQRLRGRGRRSGFPASQAHPRPRREHERDDHHDHAYLEEHVSL
jgi:hypothetical protein